MESPQCDCDTKQDCGEYSYMYALNLFLEEDGADIGDAFLYFHVPECG